MTFDPVEALLAEAVRSHASPAVTVEVGHRDRVLWRHAVGRLTYGGDAPLATLDTIFDLASLTKVIATTSLAMRLVAEHRLSLDEPVGARWADWSAGLRAHVTPRHLLDHSSGLPAHARLWESASGRRAYLDAIAALPLVEPAGTSAVYSDVGFIALGSLLEDVATRSLDEQFADFGAATGLDLTYGVAGARADTVAPTEYDRWRHRMLQGEVHDENAAALGGVAGHAGLFGTVTAVGTFARLVLTTFHVATPLGTPDLMRTFSTPSTVAGSSRALGWDTMRPTSSCGRLLSRRSIGHTGFTGPSLWIDGERDLYIALLANRVYPSRSNDAWVRWRPRIHEAIVEAVDRV